MTYFKMCWFALQMMLPDNPSPHYLKAFLKSSHSRLLICEQVAQTADKHDLCPALAVAIAFRESRFSNTTSPKGARGPLGVIPKYIPSHICKNPRKNCDYTKAAIHAFHYWNLQNPTDLCTSLAQYNAGNKGSCNPNSPGASYAQDVLHIYSHLLPLYDGDCSEYETGC
jgi:hypothetical protein